MLKGQEEARVCAGLDEAGRDKVIQGSWTAVEGLGFIMIAMGSS